MKKENCKVTKPTLINEKYLKNSYIKSHDMQANKQFFYYMQDYH